MSIHQAYIEDIVKVALTLGLSVLTGGEPLLHDLNELTSEIA